MAKFISSLYKGILLVVAEGATIYFSLYNRILLLNFLILFVSFVFLDLRMFNLASAMLTGIQSLCRKDDMCVSCGHAQVKGSGTSMSHGQLQ